MRVLIRVNDCIQVLCDSQRTEGLDIVVIGFSPDLWDGYAFLVTFQIKKFSFVMLQVQSFQETFNSVK